MLAFVVEKSDEKSTYRTGHAMVDHWYSVENHPEYFGFSLNGLFWQKQGDNCAGADSQYTDHASFFVPPHGTKKRKLCIRAVITNGCARGSICVVSEAIHFI